MKSLNPNSLSNIITALGSGSSAVISVVAMTLYVELPVEERSAFLIVVIVLSILTTIGQLLNAVINRLNVKTIEIEKPVEKQKVIIVREQESGIDKMTDIWEYQ